MKSFHRYRWSMLAATIPISICMGSIFAWSVYAIPLSEKMGLSLAAVTVAYTASQAVGGASTILGGVLYDKYNPRLVLGIAGVLIGIGYTITSVSDSILPLYLAYGGINGIAIGTSYCTYSANTANAFPDRKGLTSGMVLAGYGAGSFVFSPFANMMIERYGVSVAFRIQAAIVFVVIVLLAQFIKKPPEGCEATLQNEAGASRPDTGVAHADKRRAPDKDWRQLLRDPSYYCILGMVIVATTTGLMIIGHGSSMFQTGIGATAQTAAWLAGIVSVCNALGRIVWPACADRIGRGRTIMVSYALETVVLIALALMGSGAGTAIIAAMFIAGFCYGGQMGSFPALSIDNFGAKHSGTNFGMIQAGCIFGSAIGPTMAAIAKDNTGSFKAAFAIAAAFCIAGIILARITGKRMQRS